MRGKGKGFRNNCKGCMEKTKEDWMEGRDVGMSGVGGSSEGKM